MAARKRRQNGKPTAQGANALPPDMNILPRVALALRLRRMGHTYETIAQMAGYQTEAGARLAIKRANAKIIRDEGQALVGFQLDMLDAALQVVMRRIIADDASSLWAIDRLPPLLKRQADLLALDKRPDAPTDQQRMYLIGCHDDGTLPPLPAGVPQPRADDYVAVLPQSVIDAL